MTKREPLNDLVRIRDHMSRLIDEAMDKAPAAGRLGMGWNFTMDIYEYPSHFILAAELPGLAPEEIEIIIADTTVTLRGERRLGLDAAREECHQIERFHGPYTRSFTLPAKLSPESVARSYNAGTLEVRVAKLNPTGAAEATRRG